MLWKLIRDFKLKNGRMPFGRELEQLKKMASELEYREKLVRIPEKNFPPFYEARPMEGPKAEVKQFPKEKIVRKPSETTEPGGLERIEKELEDMQEIGKEYKDTSVSDFLSDYFDMPKKTTPKKTITELNGVKLYGDETFEELQIIKETGEHPRNKAAGGRIGYAEGVSAEEAMAGRLPPNYKFLEDADLKRSPEGIVMEGYQDTTTLDMLRDALRGAPKTPSAVEYDDGTLYYPELDEYYNEDGKQVEGPAFWARPIPKLFEVPKHQERKSIDLANGGRIGFKKGFPKIKIKTPKGAREPLKRAAGTYGSGEDLYKILKEEGITMDQAVKEAIDDMPRLSGDTKYDADAVADVVYEKLGIDPTTLDQYHLLDVYDNAYQQLVKQKRKSMYQTAAEDSLKKMDPEADTYAKELEYDVNEQISKPGYKGVVTEASDLDDTLKIIESQKSEATKLREQYPGISEALLNKLVKDNNPQRKAEVLAALDEVLTMMDKGMDEKQIMNVLRSTTRTKNQDGGLSYLLGM